MEESRSGTVDINFISNRDIVAENRDVFQTRPSPNSAVPPNNRAFDPCMVLDPGALEQYASLKSDTIANHAIRANSNIWTNATILPNLGTGINEHISTIHKTLLH